MVDYLNIMSRVNAAVYGALQADINELAKIQMRPGHRAASDKTSETTGII